MPVEGRDLYNELVEPFDLFIGYACKENETEMVSALVESIEADFAPSLPLKVFFDQKSILDFRGLGRRGECVLDGGLTNIHGPNGSNRPS
jgi:hypothetical protein